jgi:VIT1/CCC1 family predicted Fe2+/Mn2+ transporter
MTKKKSTEIRSNIPTILPHLGENNNNKTGERLSEIILGGQDGLVNTLGVILGVAAASQDFRIIMAGGLAGAIAESVSMAAVGYTSKLAEKDFYTSALKREKYEIEHLPEVEKQEIKEIFVKKGFTGKLLEEAVETIISNKKVWLDTMMREELDLTPVDGSVPFKSAFLIGLAAILGSLVPLLSFAFFYFAKIKFPGDIQWSIIISLVISAIALFIVGVVKSRLTIGKWYKSGTQMVVIGILSALFGYFVGALFAVPPVA